MADTDPKAQGYEDPQSPGEGGDQGGQQQPQQQGGGFGMGAAQAQNATATAGPEEKAPDAPAGGDQPQQQGGGEQPQQQQPQQQPDQGGGLELEGEPKPAAEERGAPMSEMYAAPEPEEKQQKPAAEKPAPKKAGGVGLGKKEAPPAKKAAPKKEDVSKRYKFKSAGLDSGGNHPKTPAGKKGAGDEMPSGALMSVVTRNNYYRDGFRNLLKIAIIEGVIIVAMIVAFIVFMNASKPQDRYFATTADGRIMRLVPLNQPNMTRAALMSWVSQAATDVMTFGFHDYQKRLQESSRHFTRRGWESFTKALQKSRIIESVEENQQVVTATPRSAPILLQEGVFAGKYRWIVQLPLMVTYRSGSRSRTDNLMVSITIERVPTLESTNGVGIEQWVAI